MSAFGPIIKPLWHLIRKAQDQVQQVQREVYQWENFRNCLQQGTPSTQIMMDHLLMSSLVHHPAFMALTEKFFTLIFKNIFNRIFSASITYLQASHFQLGVFMFKYFYESRASRSKRRVKVQPPPSSSERHLSQLE